MRYQGAEYTDQILRTLLYFVVFFFKPMSHPDEDTWVNDATEAKRQLIAQCIIA